MKLEDQGPIDQYIERYINESLHIKMKMQSRLFTLFTECTGHRPEDLCLVEQQIKKDTGDGYKTIYFFDYKHRHQEVGAP